MSLHICVLASGSSGNATVIWNKQNALLIDCGRSKRFVEEAFRAIRCDIATLKGILITHGHGDHINSGTIILARHHRVPIYIHKDTYAAVLQKETCKRIAFLEPGLVCHHSADDFSIGDFRIRPFATFHNGGFVGRSFGFAITCVNGTAIPSKIGFLTDTGMVDDTIVEALTDSHALILEANHDPVLVEMSDRHPMNKEWILSDFGHLSNQANADTITKIILRSKDRGKLRHIFMAHISEQHNTPHIAYRQIKAILDRNNIGDVQLIPTYHRKRSLILTV